MTLEVQLFATLARFLPLGGPGLATVTAPEGSTVGDVIAMLGVPSGLAWVALVNGTEATAERPLATGDVLSLFPPLAGGATPAPRTLRWRAGWPTMSRQSPSPPIRGHLP